MTESQLTYSSFSKSILEDMVTEIIQDIISRSLANEKTTRQDYGSIKNPRFLDQNNLRSENTPLVSLRKPNNSNNNSNGNGNNGVQSSSLTGTLQPANPQEPDIGRFEFVLNGQDIFVNALNENRKFLGDKVDAIVTGTGQDTYFKCTNCDRKIAGSRFAAHIDKCLGGRSRK